MMTGKWEVPYRVVISLFCVAILGMQGATLVGTVTGKPVWSWYWPIIDYPMYDTPHVAGDHVNAKYLMEATLDDGRVVSITKETLGLSIWNFQYLARDIAKGDRKALHELQALYANRDHLVEVRVNTLPVIVTEKGMREGHSVLLNRMEVRAE